MRVRWKFTAVLGLGALSVWPAPTAYTQQGPTVFGGWSRPPIAQWQPGDVRGPIASKALVARAIERAYLNNRISDAQRDALRIGLPGLAGVVQAGPAISGTTSQGSEGGGGGGLAPGYVMAADSYGVVIALNTAGRKEVRASPGEGGVGVAGALLSPGALTQSINLLAQVQLNPFVSPAGHVVDAIADLLVASWGELYAPLLREGAVPERIAADGVPRPNEAKVLARRIYRFVRSAALDPAPGGTEGGKDQARAVTADSDSPSDAAVVTGLFSVYLRLSAAAISVAGPDPADADKTASANASLIAPSLGVQWDLGDRTNSRKLHVGVALGVTGRLLGGDITRHANKELMAATVGRKTFWGPEATLYLNYKEFTPYVRWTQMNSGDLPGFSGSQLVFGFEVSASNF